MPARPGLPVGTEVAEVHGASLHWRVAHEATHPGPGAVAHLLVAESGRRGLAKKGLTAARPGEVWRRQSKALPGGKPRGHGARHFRTRR